MKVEDSAGVKSQRDEFFISSQLLEALFGAAGRSAVFARDDPHEFERKVGPDKLASCAPAVLFEPPLQIVRRSDVDVIVPAAQGIYAPPFITSFQPVTYRLTHLDSAQYPPLVKGWFLFREPPTPSMRMGAVRKPAVDEFDVLPQDIELFAEGGWYFHFVDLLLDIIELAE